METPNRSALVVKSNRLIEAMVDFSLMESRLFAFAVSLLDRDLLPDPERNLDLEIPVLEFAQAFGLDPSQAYGEIEALAEKIEAKRIHLTSGETLDGSRVKTRLLTEQKYHDGEGRIVFQFNRHLVPHLLGLKERFTSYRIKDVYRFTRASSWRVYELLKQFKSVGKREFEVEEFKRATATTGKYPRVTDLVARIIDPALEEINQTSDIKAEFEKIKRGKRVTGFIFFIRPNESTKTPQEKIRTLAEKLKPEKAAYDPELVQILTETHKVSPKQAKELAHLARGKEEKIKQLLKKIKARFDKLETKKSLGAYTFNALKAELTTGTLPL